MFFILSKYKFTTDNDFRRGRREAAGAAVQRLLPSEGRQRGRGAAVQERRPLLQHPRGLRLGRGTGHAAGGVQGQTVRGQEVSRL